MKVVILLIPFLIGTFINGFGQNLNMIIDVNDRLVTSQISGAYLYFADEDGVESQIPTGYYPGELVLNQKAWDKINSDKTKKITLSFRYNIFEKDEQKSADFEVDMKRSHFEKKYLILHVYDFREKEYRKKYGCRTNAEYITDLNYPEGGILISCR